uniref:Uncharacterized protein n=1 Tax=Cacopsylla melanoneura TaxID=428564 RepID=A0A8D8TBR8_9HEMI
MIIHLDTHSNSHSRRNTLERAVVCCFLTLALMSSVHTLKSDKSHEIWRRSLAEIHKDCQHRTRRETRRQNLFYKTAWNKLKQGVNNINPIPSEYMGPSGTIMHTKETHKMETEWSNSFPNYGEEIKRHLRKKREEKMARTPSEFEEHSQRMVDYWREYKNQEMEVGRGPRDISWYTPAIGDAYKKRLDAYYRLMNDKDNEEKKREFERIDKETRTKVFRQQEKAVHPYWFNDICGHFKTWYKIFEEKCFEDPNHILKRKRFRYVDKQTKKIMKNEKRIAIKKFLVPISEMEKKELKKFIPTTLPTTT